MGWRRVFKLDDRPKVLYIPVVFYFGVVQKRERLVIIVDVDENIAKIVSFVFKGGFFEVFTKDTIVYLLPSKLNLAMKPIFPLKQYSFCYEGILDLGSILGWGNRPMGTRETWVAGFICRVFETTSKNPSRT